MPTTQAAKPEVGQESPQRIEVDIGAAFEMLQSSPELCEQMNRLFFVGGPALVEAQVQIERLTGQRDVLLAELQASALALSDAVSVALAYDDNDWAETFRRRHERVLSAIAKATA